MQPQGIINPLLNLELLARVKHRFRPDRMTYA